MKKSPMEVLWEELKRMFYISNSSLMIYSKEEIDDRWAKYQIETIARFGEEK